jgi:hypothetical protein
VRQLLGLVFELAHALRVVPGALLLHRVYLQAHAASLRVVGIKSAWDIENAMAVSPVSVGSRGELRKKKEAS